MYKLGNRLDPKNYHPVPLTLLIYKIMEHILVNQIIKHLDLNNIHNIDLDLNTLVKLNCFSPQMT